MRNGITCGLHIYKNKKYSYYLKDTNDHNIFWNNFRESVFKTFLILNFCLISCVQPN